MDVKDARWKRGPMKRRFMDVVKEDMQRVSVKEEDAEMEGDDLLWDQRKEES